MPLEGRQLGRYRLLRLLGSGAMGEVYLAEDVRIAQRVAIKVLRAEETPDGHDAAREAAYFFQREAMTIARLDHPNILPLYDYGDVEMNGTTLTYLVMPVRPEGSLLNWLSKRGNEAHLSPQEVAHFVCQAASALQHAHDHQIVHQDVKPSNFLVRTNAERPGLPDLLLCDFGVAKFMSSTVRSMQTVRGTPAYMAPEQWKGYAEPATDQYGLAVMAYQLLTGRLPFLGIPQHMMHLHFHSEPQPPSKFNPMLPTTLDEVVLKALAKRPAERYPSITAFAHTFQQTVQNMEAFAVPATSTRNITATLSISETEALKGTSRLLNLPDGQHIPVSIPAGVQNGQLLRLTSLPAPYTGDKKTSTLLLTIAIVHAEAEARVLPAESHEMTLISHPYSVVSGNASPLVGEMDMLGNRGNQQPRRLSRFRSALLVVFVLLLIIVGIELFYLAKAHQGGTNIGGNTPTATAQNTPNPYTHQGTLAINDPLQDNSQNNGWQTDTTTIGPACQFTAGVYTVTQTHQGLHTCFAQTTDFSNFVYEAQMKIVSGDYGGIVFCSDSTGTQFYAFRVGIDGRYSLILYPGNNPADARVLASSPTPLAFFHTGPNETNVLAVVVQNGTITLYVNQQEVISIEDESYTHGEIGVFAGTNSSAADVEFSNVRVWKV